MIFFISVKGSDPLNFRNNCSVAQVFRTSTNSSHLSPTPLIVGVRNDLTPTYRAFHSTAIFIAFKTTPFACTELESHNSSPVFSLSSIGS